MNVHVEGNNIDEMAEAIHLISTSKGFTPPSTDNLPEKLMLAVSELSEALEAHRSDEGFAHIKSDGKPDGILVEIGDAIIRCLHMMHSIIEIEGVPYSVSEILNMKINYNAGRPTMHGRNY